MRALVPPFVVGHFRKGVFEGKFRAVSLFIDISGFTPLTEALMAHDKDGAEVLSDTLSTIFDPIVNRVVARGGLIPLFAGDAFAALFLVDETVPNISYRHALEVAWWVQNHFANETSAQAVETKYGRFEVGVKVGLSHGAVKWGIAGKRDRNLFYFRGPALEGCVLAEERAGTGEILIDPGVLSSIQGVSLTEAVGPDGYHRLCAYSPQAFEPELSFPELSRQDLAQFTPGEILELQVTGEFRDVSPVFIQFEEPSSTTELHRFIVATMVEVEHFGGYLAQAAFGDKGAMLVVLFGAPVAYERITERATAFLLSLRQMDCSLRWRAGYTFGKVWTGIGGGHARCEYRAVGDNMNLAARLADGAEWGQIRASNTVRRQAGPGFRFRSLGALSIKGKRKPVLVLELLEPREIPETAILTGRMVGRQREITILRRFVQPVFEGRFAGVIYVYGNPGLGKTRLVSELRHELAGRSKHNWYSCTCNPVSQRPLEPFRQVLRRYFEFSAQDSVQVNRCRFEEKLDELITRLNESVDVPDLGVELYRVRSCLGALIDLQWDGSLYQQLSPELRIENSLGALKTLLKAESLCQPVVLELEDLHWMDKESIEFVSFLTRALTNIPLVIVCTSRYRDNGDGFSFPLEKGVQQLSIELPSLEELDVGALAGQVLGGKPSKKLVQYLARRTQGNPFFIEQLVIDLRERGLLKNVPGGRVDMLEHQTVELPVSINEVLVARLDRLDAETRSMVLAAAILGPAFELGVLKYLMLPSVDISAPMEQAVIKGILHVLGAERYAFSHALMRDAAYDLQSRSRLRELHAKAGNAIEHLYAGDLPSYYPELVHHFRLAEQSELERRYAHLAGKQAMQKCEFRTAIPMLQRTVDLFGDSESSISTKLLKSIGDCHFTLGDYKAAEGMYSSSLDLATRLNDLKAEVDVRSGLGDIALKQGQYDKAAIIAEQNLAVCESIGNEKGVADSLLRLSTALQRKGNPDEARACCERALDINRMREDHSGIGSNLNALGSLAYRSGEFRNAATYFEQTLSECRAADDLVGMATALNNLGNSAIELGEESRAMEFYEESLEIRKEVGEKHGIAASLNNLCYLPYSQGDYAKARKYAKESHQVAREIGNPHIIAMNLNNLGLFDSLEGNYAQARRYFMESIQLARNIGEPWGIAQTLCSLADTELRLGNLNEARGNLREALEIAKSIKADSIMVTALASVAELYRKTGQLDGSARLLGMIEAHPATEVDVKQTLLAPLYAALSAVMGVRELTEAMKAGADTPAVALVVQFLDV